VDTCFGIMGATEIFVDGDVVKGWGRRRERALLAALLTRPNIPFATDELTAWVWGDDELPQRPTAALSTYVSRIRKSLERFSIDAELQGLNGAYRLVVAKDVIDYHVFRGLVAEAREHARRGEHSSAAAVCERALDLGRGEPLADVTYERANAWRISFVQNEWLPANILLIESWLRDHSFDQAVSLLGDLQGNHPQEIRLIALRMSALHGLGRGDEATDLYLGTARRLRAEEDEHAALFLRRHQDSLLAPLTRPPSSAAAKEATATPPRLLPPDITGFVGRTDLLRELDDAVDTATSSVAEDQPIRGVVSVDGMAGVGKTALILHWSHRVRDRFPGGTLHINLDGFSERDPVSPATVVDDFLIALERPPHPDSSLRYRQVQLSKLLATRRALIVLDNARNTDHVQELLPALANSFVVVTSRQQLTKLTTLTGARRVRVDPMHSAESTALLARHLGRDLLDEDTAHRVHDLSAGLPLVLRLLADYLAQHTEQAPGDVLDRLDRRQLITTLGATGDGAINASALFRQSYLALSAPERRLMRLLPICPGSDFSVATSCACDGRLPHETIRSLGILVGAHLLEGPDHTGRYHFHDLLAEFAAHCLDTDETEIGRRDAERRVLTCYLHTAVRAAQFLYPGQPAAPPLPADLATDSTVEPAPITDREQARRWFDQDRTALVAAVAMATTHGHHELAWRLADPIGTDFDRCGYLHDSRTVREHSVVSARATGHRIAEASSLMGLGLDHMHEANHQQARECFTAALQLIEEQGDEERGQAAVLHLLGRLEALQDNNSVALRLFRRSLDIATRCDDTEVQTWTNCRLGHLLRALDQHDDAILHLHRAAALAQTIDERSAHASSLTGLAGIFLDNGDLDTAATHCAQALALAKSVPDIGITAEVHLDLAEIAMAAQRTAAAVTNAQQALELCERTHNVTIEARAHDTLATALHTAGQLEDALPHWRTAAALYRRTGNPDRANHTDHKANAYDAQALTLPATRPSEHPNQEPPTDIGWRRDRDNPGTRGRVR
jgi:tetratricopeptide (TPR) repeat protein/DNA-binding SARP family transcriptional activator